MKIPVYSARHLIYRNSRTYRCGTLEGLRLRLRSHRASAAAAASSLVMGHIDLQWSHTHQASATVSLLAMTLGIGPGPIWYFDASDAADARCERALRDIFIVVLQCTLRNLLLSLDYGGQELKRTSNYSFMK